MVDLKFQRRIAARILKVGENRVRFNENHLKEISEALTAEDIRDLIKKGYIYYEEYIGQSRGRARILHEKRKKGRRRGKGSRKGARGARVDEKRVWINKIRKLRKFLKFLKNKGILPIDLYRRVYKMAKGGYFRDLSHMKEYLKKALADRGIKVEIK